MRATDPVVPSGVPPCPTPTLACTGHNTSLYCQLWVSIPCCILAQCRWDNCPLYEPPTESSLGAQSILKSLTVTNRDACVTCHTCHTSVTDFRPKSGNPVEVTLVTSPKLYIVSHAKGTDFP